MMADIIRSESLDVGMLGAVEIPEAEAVDFCRRMSRGTAKRIRKNAAVDARVRESLTALNLLRGVSSPVVARDSLNEFSSAVRGRVRDLHMGRAPPRGYKPQEACDELLGCGVFGYDDHSSDAKGDSSNTVALAREKLSWPERGHIARNLARFLPASTRLQFEGTEADWVRPAKAAKAARRAEEVPRAHMDDGLRRNRSEYRRFVREAIERGLLDLRLKVLEQVGVFSVKKKMEHKDL